MPQPQHADPDQLASQQYRTLLFSVAYRILGSAADAEDAVQDAWLKWSAADRSQVADPKAYLTRIVSNLAMERLRSTRHQRETYVGPWLPEPILTTPDTADCIATTDSVSTALLVVLETVAVGSPRSAPRPTRASNPRRCRQSSPGSTAARAWSSAARTA